MRRSAVAVELERHAQERGYADELRAFRRERPKLTKAQRELVGRAMKQPAPKAKK